MLEEFDSLKDEIGALVLGGFSFNCPHLERGEPNRDWIGVVVEVFVVHSGSFYNNARKAKFRNINSNQSLLIILTTIFYCQAAFY